MALGLERWFPRNNTPFAYGTRLCEEIGELLEAIQDMAPDSANTSSRQHVVKECADVLQVVVGIVGSYGCIDRLALDLKDYLVADRLGAREIVSLAVTAGKVADAINHLEGQGIKQQKHGETAEDRLLQSANALIRAVAGVLEQNDLISDFEAQLQADYAYLRKAGYIID